MTLDHPVSSFITSIAISLKYRVPWTLQFWIIQKNIKQMISATLSINVPKRNGILRYPCTKTKQNKIKNQILIHLSYNPSSHTTNRFASFAVLNSWGHISTQFQTLHSANYPSHYMQISCATRGRWATCSLAWHHAASDHRHSTATSFYCRSRPSLPYVNRMVRGARQ